MLAMRPLLPRDGESMRVVRVVNPGRRRRRGRREAPVPQPADPASLPDVLGGGQLDGTGRKLMLQRYGSRAAHHRPVAEVDAAGQLASRVGWQALPPVGQRALRGEVGQAPHRGQRAHRPRPAQVEPAIL